MHSYRRFVPKSEVWLLVQAAAILISLRLALWLFPACRVVKRTALMRHRHDRHDPARCSPRRVAWAVRVISRRVPKATCLTQALATQVLLSRFGCASAVRIGVALDDNGLFCAHAWVEVDGLVVVGGGAVERYTALPDLTRNTSPLL